jgi:hypothetical protein
MKIFAFALMALMTAGSAFADFLPGRVRPGAVAKMEVVQGSGIFSGLQQAMLYQNFEDGKGFVSLKLAVPGGVTLDLPVSGAKDTSCGNFAWSDDLRLDGLVLNSEFSDFSQPLVCGVHYESKWRLSLEMADTEGNRSVLLLEGNPEILYLTL